MIGSLGIKSTIATAIGERLAHRFAYYSSNSLFITLIGPNLLFVACTNYITVLK